MIVINDVNGNLLVSLSETGIVLANGATLTMTQMVNANGDAAAAAQGVQIGQVYRSGSTLKVRVH